MSRVLYYYIACKAQPQLAVTVRRVRHDRNAEVAIVSKKKSKRKVPVSSSYKSQLLDVAFTPVRGVKNAVRLFGIGVGRVHDSTMAVAHAILLVQSGGLAGNTMSLRGFISVPGCPDRISAGHGGQEVNHHACFILMDICC